MLQAEDKPLDEYTDYFYYFLSRDCDGNGVWYEFRIPRHSYGLLIKINPESFTMTIGKNRKWWIFTDWGPSYGKGVPLPDNLRPSFRDISPLLRKNDVIPETDATIIQKPGKNPSVVFPKDRMKPAAAVAADIFRFLFHYDRFGSLIYRRTEAYMRGFLPAIAAFRWA